MADQNKTQEQAKSYSAEETESKWYQFWEESNLFNASPQSDKPPFTIVLPPPNVTGVLHMGHALTNTLQDILIRWKRMLGFEALWVPGTDHAGISTQTVVEKHLIKTEGKNRRDYSREEFLKHVWSWKEQKEGNIINQLKRLGCSCDWSKLRFTMDEGSNRSVRTMFKKMFDEGLIYRGDYLVNWDPVTQTALADDEVEYEERNSYLWHIKYPLTDGSGHISIATTRPETMLGDTAIAVSPSDKRYTDLIGKTVLLPLQNREIPIIADHHVDPEFGSGMVKITPAHDPNDYQIGLNHDLPFINIMTPDGKINENGVRFEGLSMKKAREAVVEALKEENLIEKIEPHINRVGISYRSKATIEPYLSKQWFVKMSDFAKDLREVVESGEFKIIPENWKNSYFHWIDNLRDWCISRQLWWGHQIPIWYSVDDPEKMICWDGDGVPPEVETSPDQWRQDEDVLDTWFSSALWPFSTLRWPEKSDLLDKFYPNSVLITGHDILFFWIARMVLMGKYSFGQCPFPETYLNGLIYGKSYWRIENDHEVHYVSGDERLRYDLGDPIPKDVHWKWEKMSKSKGNVIDPIEIIEQYGTDAMRMALAASCTQARQIDLDRRKFDEFKNFANKVWNGARFVFMNLEGDEEKALRALSGDAFSKGLNLSLLSLEDRWILSILNRRIDEVNKKLASYHFDQAAMEAYDFFWKEFCAYYVEIAKPVLFGKVGTAEERENKQKLLVIVLCSALRLIHPMAPYITEDLFQKLKERLGEIEVTEEIDPYTAEAIEALNAKGCIVAPYPQIIAEEDISEKVERLFDLVSEMVYTVRNIRGEMKIPPSVPTDIFIVAHEGDPLLSSISENLKVISALVRCQSLQIVSEEPEVTFSSTGTVDRFKIVIPLPAEMIEKEMIRLEKEREKLTSNIEKLETQLSNSNFTERAPKHLVDKQRKLLEQATDELKGVELKLEAGGKMIRS